MRCNFLAYASWFVWISEVLKQSLIEWRGSDLNAGEGKWSFFLSRLGNPPRACVQRLIGWVGPVRRAKLYLVRF